MKQFKVVPMKNPASPFLAAVLLCSNYCPLLFSPIIQDDRQTEVALVFSKAAGQFLASPNCLQCVPRKVSTFKQAQPWLFDQLSYEPDIFTIMSVTCGTCLEASTDGEIALAKCSTEGGTQMWERTRDGSSELYQNVASGLFLNAGVSGRKVSAKTRNGSLEEYIKWLPIYVNDVTVGIRLGNDYAANDCPSARVCMQWCLNDTRCKAMCYNNWCFRYDEAYHADMNASSDWLAWIKVSVNETDLTPANICDNNSRPSKSSSSTSPAWSAVFLLLVPTIIGCVVLAKRYRISRHTRTVKDDQIDLAIVTKRCSDDNDAGVLLEMIWPHVAMEAIMRTGILKPEERATAGAIIERFELKHADNLIIQNEIAAGHFSRVHLGILSNTMEEVAVKRPKKAEFEQYASLVAELAILAHVGEHPNVLALRGAITRRTSLHRFCLITQFCKHGALNTFLQASHVVDNPYSDVDEYTSDTFESKQKTLSTMHVLWFAYQIATGLNFLHSKGIIHRDVAARNVLVADSLVLKLADFGLSKCLVRYSAYESKSPPWPWLAIECIRSNSFSQQSDVWSYGVVLWEIFSLGKQPEPVSQPNVQCEPSLLFSASVLDKPKLSPPDVYAIMKRCCVEVPSERPTPIALIQQLKDIGEREYPFAFTRLMQLPVYEEVSESNELPACSYSKPSLKHVISGS